MFKYVDVAFSNTDIPCLVIRTSTEALPWGHWLPCRQTRFHGNTVSHVLHLEAENRPEHLTHAPLWWDSKSFQWN